MRPKGRDLNNCRLANTSVFISRGFINVILNHSESSDAIKYFGYGPKAVNVDNSQTLS